MGLLYDAKVELERVIRERELDEIDIKGKLSLKSGVLFPFLRPETPDNPVKLEKLRVAARQLLGIEL